ncbi:MAG: hypothetical protein U0526_00045 [Candidatus Saccharibacteria bacterium]
MHRRQNHAGAAGAALVVGFGVVATAGVDEVAGLGATDVALPPAVPDDH